MISLSVISAGDYSAPFFFQMSPAFNLQQAPPSKLDSATQPLGASALSFDAMLAAKQADRIMCDICNKEVCASSLRGIHLL